MAGFRLKTRLCSGVLLLPLVSSVRIRCPTFILPSICLLIKIYPNESTDLILLFHSFGVCSVPEIDFYLAQRYATEWPAYVDAVRWNMLPCIW